MTNGRVWRVYLYRLCINTSDCTCSPLSNLSSCVAGRLGPGVLNDADAATVFFPVSLKAQTEVRLVASYTPDALTEYLRDRAKFNGRGCTLSTPPHVAGAQRQTEDHFDQVLFVLLASNLLSVEARHVARTIMYIKSMLSTKLAKKFHELWVIAQSGLLLLSAPPHCSGLPHHLRVANHERQPIEGHDRLALDDNSGSYQGSGGGIVRAVHQDREGYRGSVSNKSSAC